MTVRSDDRRSDRGIGLVVALMATTVVAALAAAGLLNASVEQAIAAGYREQDEAHYVLEAALERATAELAAMPDWTPALNGSVRSRLLDGPAGGERRLVPGGVGALDIVDLDRVVSLAGCGLPEPCQPSDFDRVTAARPWGPNNPHWQLFGYGPEDLLMTSTPPGGRRYVVVLVGDDPAEVDDDPSTDGAAGEPGHDIVELQGHVFGANGRHLVRGLTIARGVVRANYGAGAHGGVRILDRKFTATPG